jgi:hypothetical protein
MFASCCLLAWLTLQPWIWRQYIAHKHQLLSTRQHGITSEKIVLFIAKSSQTRYGSDYNYYNFLKINHCVYMFKNVYAETLLSFTYVIC